MAGPPLPLGPGMRVWRAVLSGLLLGVLAACTMPGWPPGGGRTAGTAETAAPAADMDAEPEDAPEDAPAELPVDPDDPAPPADPAPSDPPPTVLPAPEPPPDTPIVAAQRRACAREGGTLQPRASGILACVRTTRDAGQRCTASRECEGECLARSGTCAPFTPLFGCHEVLLAPGSQVTQCLE